MGLKIISSLSNFIINMITNIIHFPRWLVLQVRNVINHFAQIRTNLKDMTKTNLDLGKYHFYNRNLGDAVFRFKMVERFFDPGNKQACYYLGWCYMQKGEIAKALEYLVKAGDADEVNLRQFLRAIDVTERVPSEIEKICRDIIADDYEDQFFSEEHYLPIELVNEINTSILEIPAKYEILELGCNVGVCGAEMRKRLPEQFHLTGVENSQIMYAILQNAEDAAVEKNYSQLINMPVAAFLKNNKAKYDLIISLNGFAFTNNLEEFFAQVKLALNQHGYFAFATKISDQTILDKFSLEFSYNSSQVIETFKSNSFKIIAEKELKLEKNNIFYIFVVKLA